MARHLPAGLRFSMKPIAIIELHRQAVQELDDPARMKELRPVRAPAERAENGKATEPAPVHVQAMATKTDATGQIAPSKEAIRAGVPR